ncbi:ribonuclease P protein subunit [Candidatus Micrarchaeota archaeon]|nr:ribonuclease P protein subunit [Candidatus Micrarchaeota archaeon]
MISKSNLLYSTFIGLKVEIVKSTVRNLIGTSGAIVDETKNLIVIEKESGRSKKEIKIPKISSTFRFYLADGQFVDVEGRNICFRPHERPKKI